MRRALCLFLAGAVLLTTACGSSAPKVDAATLLQRAKIKADGSFSVHFTLTSSNVATSGTSITSGSGVLVRPDSLQGSFTVTVDGLGAKVSVVSVGGVFEAKLPFSTSYQKTDPSKFGLTDPAQLLDPSKGLTNLLTLAQSPRYGSQKRVGGELLDTVTYSVPGSDIPVLPDANPSRPVTLTVAVDPSNNELRTVTIVGPLTSASFNSTFVVTLTNYDESVTVRLPAS